MNRPDYGLDSPAMVAGHFIFAAICAVLAWFNIFHLRWLEIALAAYALQGGIGMIRYSKSSKFNFRDLLLDSIAWRGDESVLDVGCGKGLVLVGAAKRLTTGTATGVDIWLSHAITGNAPDAVMENAAREGVAGHVRCERGDVRQLPFADAQFDVVLSNFVVHELNAAADRTQMIGEMIRVLKPGGHLALIDFIFTSDCVETLRSAGLQATRARIPGWQLRVVSALTFGAFQPYIVTATK